MFNDALRRNDKTQINTLTKLYALFYSSFAEISFLKVIHTPYGLSLDSIVQIKNAGSLNQKWSKCLELVFLQIDNMTNKGDIANKKRKLSNLIENYIINPSQIRNKIAHGQWVVALNKENSNTNPQTTQQIQALDFVQIDILFLCYEKIAQIIEDLIESPHKAHFNDFFLHLSELEQKIEECKKWDIDTKRTLLLKKPISYLVND